MARMSDLDVQEIRQFFEGKPEPGAARRQAPKNANAQKSARRGFQPVNLGKTNPHCNYEPLGRTHARRAQGDALRFQRRTIQSAGKQDATSFEDGKTQITRLP